MNALLVAKWSDDQLYHCAIIEVVKSRVVSATELKAKCLALLDEVDDRGQTITVTKRGRPVATLQPVKKKSWKSPKGAWIGKVKIVGDIVQFDSAHLWDALRKD